jgi:hypothetical protein
MPQQNLGQRVLSRLLQKLGGPKAAAQKLEIPDDLLEAYLDGKRPVPENIWLRAVDHLMADLTDIPPHGRERPEDPDRTR